MLLIDLSYSDLFDVFYVYFLLNGIFMLKYLRCAFVFIHFYNDLAYPQREKREKLSHRFYIYKVAN